MKASKPEQFPHAGQAIEQCESISMKDISLSASSLFSIWLTQNGTLKKRLTLGEKYKLKLIPDVFLIMILAKTYTPWGTAFSDCE